MRVDYAFTAEAADSAGGLFYVTRGGADIFFLPQDFPRPLRLGAISFVFRVAGDAEEIGQTVTLRCGVVDADGHPVSFQQDVQAGFERHPIDPTRATASVVAFRFYGFPLPDFGTYLFEVHHGDERLAQVPFWVVPVDPANPPPGLGPPIGPPPPPAPEPPTPV